MTQRAAFEHHDRIAESPPGSVLMVCEPIRVQRMPHGNMIRAEPGLWLRVKFVTGGLWCEAAIDGKVQTIVVSAEDYGALDERPQQADDDQD